MKYICDQIIVTITGEKVFSEGLIDVEQFMYTNILWMIKYIQEGVSLCRVILHKSSRWINLPFTRVTCENKYRLIQRF